MDIKLEQYRIFCVAAEAGSFSEAAKRLYITQSAVSQHIRSLEEALGVILFVRGRKGATLTAQGELLFGYAKRSLEELENAESLFQKMRSLTEGSLRIGAGDTLTRYFLLEYLERFHNRYPGIQIEIVNRVTGETLSKLSSGKVDMAFVNLPVEESRYYDIDIREVGLLHDVFIAGNKFSHLKGKALSMTDLASLPLVMLEPKSNTRQNTDRFFAEHGVTLRPEIELGSHDLLFDFARMNLGIACVTEEFSRGISEKDVFKLTTDFRLPPRRIGLCTLKNVAPTPAISKLTEMIME